MTEWQPIETAPKDGTEVLLWGRYWSDSQGLFSRPHVGSYVENLERWQVGVSHHDYRFRVRPTHWMPLPPPPGP